MGFAQFTKFCLYNAFSAALAMIAVVLHQKGDWKKELNHEFCQMLLKREINFANYSHPGDEPKTQMLSLMTMPSIVQQFIWLSLHDF